MALMSDLNLPDAPARNIIHTRDGDRMMVYRWEIDNPRGVVMIVHGVGGHGMRAAEFAKELNDAGYTAFAPDQLAHGATGEMNFGRSELGPGGNTRAVRALEDLTSAMQRRYEGLPFFYYGHSWGSLLGQRVVRRRGREFDGAILGGTTIPVPGFINMGNLNAAYEPDPSGMQWLSRNPAAVDEFNADPDCFDFQEEPVWNFLEATQLLSIPKASFLPGSPSDLPLLIMAGSEDPLSFNARGTRALDWAYRNIGGHDDVTLKIYPGARHDLLSETNADEVLADIVNWLNAHTLEVAR